MLFSEQKLRRKVCHKSNPTDIQYLLQIDTSVPQSDTNDDRIIKLHTPSLSEFLVTCECKFPVILVCVSTRNQLYYYFIEEPPPLLHRVSSIQSTNYVGNTNRFPCWYYYYYNHPRDHWGWQGRWWYFDWLASGTVTRIKCENNTYSSYYLRCALLCGSTFASVSFFWESRKYFSIRMCLKMKFIEINVFP